MDAGRRLRGLRIDVRYVVVGGGQRRRDNNQTEVDVNCFTLPSLAFYAIHVLTGGAALAVALQLVGVVRFPLLSGLGRDEPDDFLTG